MRANQDLSALGANDIEDAFFQFYDYMIQSEHFKVFFEGQAQIKSLIVRQADNFYKSLSMSDEAFRQNYVDLGLMHAQMKLPFEDIVSALTLIRDALLKSTEITPTVLYDLIEKMERFLARGYLHYQFEDVLQQLTFSNEHAEASYTADDLAIVAGPLIWLKNLVTIFQSGRTPEHQDILTADGCPLTPMIHRLGDESELKERILLTHTEQHSLALSMAFFFKEEDYMLASFMFDKLFAITISLSNQIGLAVSYQTIEALHFDALTGLMTRHSLQHKLQTALKQAALHSKSCAVMLLDLDYFKKINDTHGHPAGDSVLEALGKLVQKNQREHDLAFRYGGEEFLFFFANISSDNASRVAQRIRKEVESLSIKWQNYTIPLTLSIGCLTLRPDQLNAPIQVYIEKADQNLYQAKAQGRNQVVCSEF